MDGVTRITSPTCACGSLMARVGGVGEWICVNDVCPRRGLPTTVIQPADRVQPPANFGQLDETFFTVPDWAYWQEVVRDLVDVRVKEKLQALEPEECISVSVCTYGVRR